MTANLPLLLVLLWIPFLMFQKKSLLFVSFAATMVYIFNAMGIAAAGDTAIFWIDLFLFASSMLAMILEKERK